MKNIVDCVSCPVRLPEDVATEVDAIVKNLPAEQRYHTKAVPVNYMFEPNERAEVSILSTDQVDQSNEVVLPEGIGLDAYRRSMAVLWSHKKDQPPIATCGWIKLHHNELRAKTIYPQKPQDVECRWFTDEIWALIKCQPPILRSKSIGFINLTPMRPPTQEELLVHPEWKSAGITDSSLLLEYSCVYNGCNTDALVQAISDKSVDAAVLKEMGIEVPITEKTYALVPPCHLNCACNLDASGWHTSGLDNVCDYCQNGSDEWNANHQIQSLSVEDAIAYVMKLKPKHKKKKIDWNRVIESAVNHIDLDRVIDKAVDMYKNRGKV